MSNIEMIHIHNPESDHSRSPPAVSDSQHRSNLSQGENGTGEDVEQTPASSAPFVSPLRSSQDGRGSLLISIWQWALVFFPTICVAYLIFCYVVHYRVVPAKVPGLSADTTTQFLSK